MRVLLTVIICAFTASVTPTFLFQEDTPEEKTALYECFNQYNIKSDVMSIDENRGINPIAELSAEKKGCFNACLYKVYKWMKPDGSLDFDSLFEGANTLEGILERRRTEYIVMKCRIKHGNNDCKFFQCFAK